MKYLARSSLSKNCLARLFCALTLPLFMTAHWAHAEDQRKESWTFANCHLIESDLAQSATNVETSKRTVAMEQLLKDMRKLFDERTLAPGLSPYPMNYLKNCFEKKNQALSQFGKNAPDSFKASTTYLKIFAQENLLNAQLSFGKNQVEYYKTAYDLFSKIVDRDPTDWNSKEDRLRTYVRLNRYRWELGGKNGETALAKNSVNGADLEEYRKTSIKLIQDIINDPQVSADKKITCYKFLIASTESMMMRNNETVADWKKILELNPKDIEALTSVGNYHYQHKQYKEALPYFEKLSTLKPDSELALNLYMDCLFEIGDFATLKTRGTLAIKKFPKNSALRARMARAKLELNLFSEAKEENLIALKLNSKDPLARATQSFLLEYEADAAVSKNLLSTAIQTYEKAYQIDPSRPSLKGKMARVIFLYRKEKNFQPVDVAKIEMKQVTDLLYALAASPDSRPQLKEENLEILIEATHFLKDNKKLSASCSFYEEIVGIVSRIRLQKICGEAYAQARNTEKARELLSQALSSEKNPAEKQRIKQLLNQIR